MTKYGKNRSGTQRWRCNKCNATTTARIDNAAKRLKEFLSWLLSRKRQSEMAGAGRTFRRRCAEFWKLWPIAPFDGELHRVVFADGIYLARNVVILIASTERHVIGWYMARSENAASWGALMAKIPAPEVVVCDGGSGFEKARKRHWPTTRVQRCLYHAFCQVRRYTTTRPKLQAGVELYGLAKALLRIATLKEAEDWTRTFRAWKERHDEFLEERTRYEGGGWGWTHERLRSARGALNRLISSNAMFTYLDPALTEEGPLPSTNNRLEGGVNAQLRAMLRDHRGMSLLRRAKAVFWWCYMHTECPLNAADILKTMPTDDDIEELYRSARDRLKAPPGAPAEWGDAFAWSELRHTLPWRIEWNM